MNRRQFITSLVEIGYYEDYIASISGLDLWLDADDISGNDGDSVNSWADRSSASNDATAVSAPVLKKGANGINGKNVVLFTSDYLTSPALSGTPEQTVISVARLTTVGSGVNHSIFEPSDSAAIELKVVNAAVQFTIYTVETMITSSVSAVAATPYLFAARYSDSGNLAKLKVNDVENSASPTGSCTTGRTVYIGARYGPTNYLDGSIGTLMHFNSYVSDANMVVIERYLKAKYGI